jgi:hypothetical protein
MFSARIPKEKVLTKEEESIAWGLFSMRGQVVGYLGVRISIIATTSRLER